MWCAYCGSNQHEIENCPKTWGGQANRNAMRCTYCGARDHNYSSCPKLGNRGNDKVLDREIN